MISVVFAAAHPANAEADFTNFSGYPGRVLISRSPGEHVDYFAYRRSDAGLTPDRKSFTVSSAAGQQMYVIYATFNG